MAHGLKWSMRGTGVRRKKSTGNAGGTWPSLARRIFEARELQSNADVFHGWI
jgi:hypothetical protein